MKKRTLRFYLTAMWIAVVSCAYAQEPIEGYAIYTHDPSTLVKESNRYYYFMTSDNLIYHWSTDLRNWNNHAEVFPSGPEDWVTNAVQDFDPGNWAWAPDVAFFNGKYHVYYSVSEWGSIDSVIGLVTTPSLISPSWSDEGKVVQSDAIWDAVPETDTTDYNCIDPAILVDTNGTIWMVFGSYSEGILVTEIDPSTGLRMNTNTLVATQIADNDDNGVNWGGNTTEGGFIYQHGGYYYLFLNFGGCCSGVNSTYNIRVGRSSSVTGPYLDKDGIDMNNGGGTMLLESSGRYVGPGHAGIFMDDDGTEWFSYHYYNGIDDGQLGWSKYSLLRVSWDGGDWPVLSDDWSAFYPFSGNAREHMDLFDATLQSGAAIVADPDFDEVLQLDGTGYAELPDAVANCSTLAAWVKWDGSTDWQRIFDFGTDTSKYMFLTPQSWPDGWMRFAIKNGGSEQIVDAPFTFPTGTWCHVAVTLDGEQGTLYFNGEAVASNAVTIRPWEILARNNYIGKSQWPDPGFVGSIASFRVFAHALDPAEIKTIAHAHPMLAHRYSFVSDVSDSIGMAHGTLKGNASISGEKLILPGTGTGHANLPGGLVSGCRKASIEFWADIGPNDFWARLFDFGNISGNFGNSFLFLTPKMSTTHYRMDMNGNTLDIPGNLNNKSVHVVCVIDPPSNYVAIYVDGVLVQEKTAATSALSTIGRQWSFIGRSLFSADPYLNADIDEFRIYDGRLSPEQIAGNFAAGPDAMFANIGLSVSNTVGGLEAEWPTYPLFDLVSTTNLSTNSTWQTHSLPFPSNGTFKVDLPSAEPEGFYRLSR